MQKRVLVTEDIDKAGIAVLKNRGIQVDCKCGLTEQDLIALVANYDGLIVRSHTQITEAVIQAAKGRLKIIGRAGVSIDNIDLDAATQAGIVVCNAPNSNIISAAEYAMGLLLACARNVSQANASTHEGQWEPGNFKGCELYEKTLAIFGLGRVGGLVAQRAAAFGMNIVAYDPYCSRERAAVLGVELYENYEDLLPIADFFSIHMPKTKETANMFGAKEFSAMKDGVIIVNVARSGIFDEKALADFIAAEKIRAVGFDVFKNEPVNHSALHEFDQALLTPHIGAATVEAQRRAGMQIATYVAQGLAGSIVPTAINMSNVPPEVIDKFGPYLTAAQSLGRILSQIEKDIPHKLALKANGTLSGTDTSVLLASALKGLMTYKNVGAVTGLNAESVAQRHGIEVSISTQIDASGYDSSLLLATDNSSIACTLYGTERLARIISLFDYDLDIEIAAQSLILRYVDAPGRIGAIGTILGESNINITTMQIGTKEDSDQAIAYLNIEGEINDEILANLKARIPDLYDLWYVKL